MVDGKSKSEESTADGNSKSEESTADGNSRSLDSRIFDFAQDRLVQPALARDDTALDFA